jgi:hypothetical protein
MADRAGRSFRTPVLAVAVGVYLPLELTTPIFLGGLLAALAARWHRAQGGSGRGPERRDGLLYASGLIAGEAIVGVLVAIPIVATGVSMSFRWLWMSPSPSGSVLGVLALIGRWLYRAAISKTCLTISVPRTDFHPSRGTGNLHRAGAPNRLNRSRWRP